jgi:hypothetical protein
MRADYEGFQASLNRSHFELAEETDKLCKKARHHISYLYEAVASLESIEQHFQTEMTNDAESQIAIFSPSYLKVHSVHLENAKNAVNEIKRLQGNAVVLMEDLCEARARGTRPTGN